MNNYLHSGDSIDVVTPAGGYISGNFYVQGLIAGVAVNTSLETEANVLKCNGVFELPKTTGQAWTIGQQLYWDPATSKFTTAPGELTSYGAAAAAAGSSDTTGEVKIGGGVPIAAGPIAQQVAEPDLTGTLTGTANGALVDVAASAGACAGGSTPTATQVDTAIATAVATIVTGVNEQNKEFETKINALLAKLRLAGVIEDA